MIVALDRIGQGKNKRRDEDRFWQEFEEARPRLLGAICDAVCGTLANLDRAGDIEFPRMADFARWGYAACLGLGWDADRFLADFNRRQKDVAAEAGDSHRLSKTIREWIRGVPGQKEWYCTWSGTAADLLELLNLFTAEERREDRDWSRNNDWPKDESALSRRLNEQAAGLRAMGVGFERGKDTSTRLIYLWWTEAYPDGEPDFKNPEANKRRFADRERKAMDDLKEDTRARGAVRVKM